jgi:hypothetical protein
MVAVVPVGLAEVAPIIYTFPLFYRYFLKQEQSVNA